MESYLTRVLDKKIRNGYITWGKKGCYVIKTELYRREDDNNDNGDDDDQ